MGLLGLLCVVEDFGAGFDEVVCPDGCVVWEISSQGDACVFAGVSGS